MPAAEDAEVRAELQARHAQVNPHFLFNSLNSITALIRTSPAEAKKMIETPADLFRYSLRASGISRVMLREELASLALYLSIERARFGNRLDSRTIFPNTFSALVRKHTTKSGRDRQARRRPDGVSPTG